MKTETADEVVAAASEARAVSVLGPLQQIEAGLVALAAESEAIPWEAAGGEKQARAYRAKCVDLRVSVDDAYESVNRPMLETQRAARALRDTLKSRVLALEAPVDAAIKAIEAAKERAREERARKEAERISEIRRRIVDAFVAPLQAVGDSSAEVAAAIAAIEAEPLDDRYADLKIEAATAKVQAIERLTSLAKKAADMDRMRAEIAAREAALAETETKAKAERAEQRRADEAERAARKAEQDAAAEALRLQRAAFEEEQRVAREAEAKRQAEADAIAEEERRVYQARVDAETARRQADERAEAERRAAVLAAQARVERAAPTMLATLHHVREGLDRKREEIEVGLLLSWICDAIEEATGTRPIESTGCGVWIAGPQEMAP
jgi:hypothetical protein